MLPLEESKATGKVAVKVNYINFEDLIRPTPNVVVPVSNELQIEKVPGRTIFNPPPPIAIPTATFASLPAKKMTRIPGAPPKQRILSLESKQGKLPNNDFKHATSI